MTTDIRTLTTPRSALGDDLKDLEQSQGIGAVREFLAAAQAPTKPAMPGYTFADAANCDIADADYLIKGWVGVGELALLFGQSGSMKSFVAADIAFHLATGRAWCGHKIKKASGVLVVLGEGQAGYRKRLKALAQHYGVTDAPIFVVPEPVALDTDADKLGAWISSAEQLLGAAIDAVLLDTFSLMLGDGDENSNGDVGKALSAARAAAGNRTLLFVHHNGHGDSGRERGAYQIRANADTRILVTRDENNAGRVISVECLKRKDDALPDPVRLSYTPVQVGTDADGNEITSIVLQPTDDMPSLPGKEKHSKPLDYIRQAINLTGSNQKEIVRQQFYALYDGNVDTKSKAFRRGWESYMQESISHDE